MLKKKYEIILNFENIFDINVSPMLKAKDDYMLIEYTIKFNNSKYIIQNLTFILLPVKKNK